MQDFSDTHAEEIAAARRQWKESLKRPQPSSRWIRITEQQMSLRRA